MAVDLRDRLQGALGASYSIERELGGAGMSRVFVATETALGRSVAIKVLPPEFDGAVSADRFRQEIRLAALLHHPHLVPLLSAGEADGLLYYTMPLVEGESLHARLTRERELPIAEVVDILREVADAMSYAHRQGVIHRDLKPGNVLLENGHALVTDFGIAKAISTAIGTEKRLTSTGLVLGTPGYMAPEQATGDSVVDHRADLYSLGIMAYEMLAGEPPFTSPSPQALVAAHLTREPELISLRRPLVPPSLADLVMHLLQKRPADRPQNAAEVIARLAEIAGSTAVPRIPSGRVRTSGFTHSPVRRRIALTAVALILLAVGGVLALKLRHPAELTPNLVAVAPFNVLDPQLATLWREGLVDLLSRNLDGAGILRAVPPSYVLRRWREDSRADRAGAADLGRLTSANYVVFGDLIPSGAGMVTLTVAVLDMGERSVLRGSEITRRGPSDRVDALADSVTVALVRAFGGSGVLAGSRGTSLGTPSVAAMRAFLEGEHYYRKTDWNSAITSYEKAVREDSSFALALWRIGSVLSWQHNAADSTSRYFLLRAGGLNRSLSRRDSLLIAADSLRASLTSFEADTGYWSRVRRLLLTVEDAKLNYFQDAEVLFALGDAYFHYGFGPRASITSRQMLEAFDRSIALDSTFAPPHIHAVELAFTVNGAEDGFRHARAYQALNPGDVSAQGIRAVLTLAPSERQLSALASALFDSLSTDALFTAWQTVRRWSDTALTAIQIAERAAQISDAELEKRRGADAWYAMPDTRRLLLLLQLTYRGQVREAFRILEQGIGPRETRIFSELVLLGGVPDTTHPAIGRWARSLTERSAALLLPWWAERGDHRSIEAFLRRTDSAARRSLNSVQRRDAQYRKSVGRAYHALALRDTAGALRLFAAVPDTLCLSCYPDRLTRGRLLNARQQYLEAARVLSERLWSLLTPIEVLFAFERGRAAEGLGDVEAAREAFEFVSKVWAKADPELRVFLTESQAAINRLGRLRAIRSDTGKVGSSPAPQ